MAVLSRTSGDTASFTPFKLESEPDPLCFEFVGLSPLTVGLTVGAQAAEAPVSIRKAKSFVLDES